MERSFGENKMVYKIDEVPKGQTRLSMFDGCQSTLQYWIPTEVAEKKKKKAQR